MHRYALEKLKDWLSAKVRKPLVLRGARQVGKTWLVRELAKQAGFELIELNFEKQRNLAVHFESNDPETILLSLSSTLNKTINPLHTILFLDEIQAAPALLAKLRWFYESMPSLAVIAAGSLLEFILENHQFSMPVGRINYFFVEPLGFEEFLFAKQENHLLSAIQKTTLNKPLNTLQHDKASQLFKEYMTIGGMPESISTWITTHSLESVAAVHNDLINTYKDDFAKYAGRLSTDYLEDVLAALPRFLTSKILYSRLIPNARHASIKQTIHLLSKARLCHIVQSTPANGIPMGAEINSKVFKMILIDIGLVSTLLGLQLYQFKALDEVMLINKGALAEQVVGQLLRLLSRFYVDPQLYYWSRETKSANAEIDYLIQDNQQLVPIEVKAGSEGKLRSLHQFMHEKRWKIAIRFYTGPLCKNHIKTKTTTGNKVEYELISLPFYLLNQTYRLMHDNKAPDICD